MRDVEDRIRAAGELDLARETEAQGTDAKAEALLELVYKLQQEENDPALKVLIFTEFAETARYIRAELDKATQLAEIRTRLEQSAGRSLRMSSAESEAFVRAEVTKWTGLMKQAGIVPE